MDEMDVCCFLDVLVVTVGSVLSTHNTIFTFYCFQRTICRRFDPKCLFSSHRVCVRFNKKNRLTFPQRKVTSSASSTSRRALNRVWSLNESNHLIIYHSAFQFTSIFITSSFFFPPINFLFLPRLGDDSEQLPSQFYSPDVTFQLLFYFRVGAERQTSPCRTDGPFPGHGLRIKSYLRCFQEGKSTGPSVWHTRTTDN